MRDKFSLEFRIIESETISQLRRKHAVTNRAGAPVLLQALPDDRRTITSYCWKVVALISFPRHRNAIDARIV